MARPSSPSIAVVLALALALGAGGVAAEPGATDRATRVATSTPGPPHVPRWWRIAVEAAAVVGTGTIWYWAQTSLQREDWELHWDWPSWRTKLTDPRTIRFDTNDYPYNAINHPFAGALYYQIGRSNGLEPAGSLGVSLALTLLWEYVVEFKEYVSLNDIVLNLHAGLAIGEPMRQASAGFRAVPGPLAAGLSALTGPFDFVHGRFGRRPAAAGPPRVHLELSVGSGAWFDGGRRPEVGFGFALDVLDVPGFGTPGADRRSVGLAAVSRIEGAQTFDADLRDPRRASARFRTRTSMLGASRRRLVDAPDGVRGREGLVALSTGFTYDTRRLAAEKDRLTLAHLAGGQVVLLDRRGPLTLRFEAGLYGDFGMVQALVFGPSTSIRPEPPLTSALAERGYYFGAGATAETLLGLDYRGFRLEGDVRGHALVAVDGLDRRETGGPDDPHGVSDQRLFGRLSLGVGLGPGPFRLRTTAEQALRRGAWSDRSRVLQDWTLGLELSATP